ncbi:MAG: hypothetical protein QOF68_1741 [Gaiellales bacterium]|jgi:hypothetical protein|nr:hypothetical protein [Gaiellales bacterium]
MSMPADFLQTHDAYLDGWQQAFATGDPSGVEPFLAEEYHGVFSTAPDTSVSVDAKVAMAGVAESVRSLKGAEQRIERRVVGRRSDDAMCVVYARIIVSDRGETTAFVTENWARTPEKGWLLHRESVEHGVSSTGDAPTA